MSPRGRVLRELALVLVVGLAVLAAAVGLAGVLAGPESRPSPTREQALFSAAEARLGRLVRDGMKTQMVEGPVVDQTLSALRRRLSDGLEHPPAELQVLLIRSETVNAYAFPGELIVITTGLIVALPGPEELAAILAHEIGHVVNRDALKALSRGLVLSALLSAGGGPQGQAVLRRLMGEVLQMRYSQAVESRADRFALELLGKARLDPGALAAALQSLREAGARDLPGVLQYVQSHPALEERIESARQYAAFGSWKKEPLQVDWELMLQALSMTDPMGAQPRIR